MKKIFIIAEAGVNHNGSVELAKKMIDEASASGADAIKFQAFKAGKLASRYAMKADYQMQATSKNETQLDMLKRLEFGADTIRELIGHCKKRSIKFLSSAFDIDSVELLDSLGIDIYKVPSGEITNLPYLRKVGSLGRKVILSTGMASMDEISNVLSVLTHSGTPLKNITVLHCTTAYPAPFDEVNLRAMLTIGLKFGVAVGYSDHTRGIEIAVAAASLGATVIEKHFTLDRGLEGPDHKASLEPDELKAMVIAIRNVEKALGNGAKTPSKTELLNRSVVRKSIVASRSIKRGELFTEENIAIKRPGTGLDPMLWNDLMGKKAKRSFEEDELIEL